MQKPCSVLATNGSGPHWFGMEIPSLRVEVLHHFSVIFHLTDLSRYPVASSSRDNEFLHFCDQILSLTHITTALTLIWTIVVRRSVEAPKCKYSVTRVNGGRLNLYGCPIHFGVVRGVHPVVWEISIGPQREGLLCDPPRAGSPSRNTGGVREDQDLG